LLNVAQQQQNSSFLVQAHYAMGLTLFFLGISFAALRC